MTLQITRFPFFHEILFDLMLLMECGSPSTPKAIAGASKPLGQELFMKIGGRRRRK
jgi:hypothetical protein